MKNEPIVDSPYIEIHYHHKSDLADMVELQSTQLKATRQCHAKTYLGRPWVFCKKINLMSSSDALPRYHELLLEPRVSRVLLHKQHYSSSCS